MSGSNKTLYLFQGIGNGAFTSTVVPSPDAAAVLRSKAAAYLDRDGKIDLFVGNSSDGAIYMYRGNGDGTFLYSATLGTGGSSNQYGVSTADFDGDGWIDLIANTDVNGQTNLFKGNGDGTFSAPVLVPSLDTNNVSAFDTGDFNNDGIVDVISANSGSKNVGFYPGNGDGTFNQKIQLASLAYSTLGISASPALVELRPALGTAGISRPRPSALFGIPVTAMQAPIRYM